MKLKLLIAMALLLIAAGEASAAGPRDTVKKLAAAVADKDGKTFAHLVDIDALLDAEPALYDSDALYIGSSSGSARYLEDRIASGVLALQCKEARRPGCAWTVDGLKKPHIRITGDSSAVAAVDNPEGIRTWIAMHKGRDGWKVVAVTVREQDAEICASEEFQKKREAYRAKRVAAENDVEKRQAEEALAAERAREAAHRDALAKKALNREILAQVTFSESSMELRTNAGYDGKQHDLVIKGTVYNGYTADVARVRWRLDFVDANGSSLGHITWIDTDTGDKTLRRGVRYERKWRVDLNGAAHIEAGALYAKGQCAITIRPDMLHTEGAFISDQP